jgi:HK97 gp10 family phage protein
MANSIKIKVTGLARLSAKLGRYKPAVKAGLTDGLNRAAALVNGHSKALCPVDTGNLRGSIHANPAEVKGDDITSSVSTATEYAAFVEFGTGVRGNGSYPYKTLMKSLAYGDRGGQVAQPFLGRALHENEFNIDKMVIQSVVRALKGVR